MTARFFFNCGAVLGGLGVGLGAFAAHSLRGHLGADMLRVFETGVRYQMFHALALLAVAWAAGRHPGRRAQLAGWCFLVGVILFSGSLYALALGGPAWLGPVTPLGGLAFLLGWGCLFLTTRA